MCPCNRRQFLGGAAGGALLAAHWASAQAMTAAAAAWPPLPTARIYKVYAGRTGDAYLTRPAEEIPRFEKHLAELDKHKGVPVIVACRLGPQSVDGVKVLRSAGFTQVLRLAGGMTEWRAQGLPLVQ